MSAFPDEDEDTITMLDVIEREDKLEEEASAVLGNSDEKNCTYLKGYIPRQALYSCATCYEESGYPAAVCLACSLECHDNHELYELYTKRNYRCDCGNSKFKQGFECKLLDKQLKKLPLNEKNKYNHNFSGKYCICDKKYPPDESDNNEESHDEMWQCINCEDWYHSNHLGANDLPSKFEELICGSCVEKLDFVHYYRGIDTAKKSDSFDPTDKQASGTSNSINNIEATAKDDVDDSNGLLAAVANAAQTVNESKTEPVSESDTNDSQAENKDPIIQLTQDQPKETKSECLLDTLKLEYDANITLDGNKDDLKKAPIFWSDCDWRAILCRCQKCMDMYKTKECEYLLDEKDTVQYYEAQGKAIARNSETPMERGMSALNQMNRAAVVEALHGYDELKADLSDYLRKFADTKKVVREEDIHEFFQQLKSKKRPRLEFE